MIKQEIPFKITEIGIIPEDWEVKKINQVTDQIFSGGTPDTRKSEYWDGTIPWLSSGETRNTFIDKTERKITESGVKNSSTRLAKVGDIVVASAGQGYTRGQVSFCMIDAYINQSVIVLRANKEVLKPLFLFYNLVSRYNELRRISDGHSSRGSLTTKLLADLNIQIPPIGEQTAIAKILTDLDLKIALNHSMNSTLEAIGQALFKHWFVDFEFPDGEGKPYRSSGGEMVDTELGEVPRGWGIAKLENFGDIVCGKTPSKSIKEFFGGKIPFIKIPDMHSNVFITETEDSLSEQGAATQKNKTIPSNSICVSCIATVGLVGITDKDSQTNQQINTLIPKNDFFVYYLFFQMKAITDLLKNLASGGSTTLNLNTGRFSEIKIVNPEENILVNFHKTLKPNFEKILINQFQTQKLSQIRDALLPKLMSGEIRVKIDSIRQN